MQEIFAHLPTQSVQPSTIGGQIFAVGYSEQPVQEVVQEEEKRSVPTSLDLNPLQTECLEGLFIFKQATADLLLRYLRMKPGSLRHLQKQLYAMHPDKEEDRYVEFIYPPKPKQSRFGSAPIVYTLGRLGYRYLKSQGFPVGRYRPPAAGVQKEDPLRHRLAVNEFLLKAILLAGDYPDDLYLLKYLHEQYWNGNPLKIRTPDRTEPEGLSPDLLIAFESYNPLNQHWLPVEINLSREWEKDWTNKVRLYRYCIPAYKERLGTDILTTILVVVASPAAFPRMLYSKPSEEDLKEREREAKRRQRRMELLKQWTEETLEKFQLRHEADLFSFSSAPLTELSPEELFFGEHWYIPFSDTPRPLLQLGKAGVS